LCEAPDCQKERRSWCDKHCSEACRLTVIYVEQEERKARYDAAHEAAWKRTDAYTKSSTLARGGTER
jgi:hypothetical protein